MQNQIEKRVEIRASVPRVWRALTDYREFGAWFRVRVEGPFVAGQPAYGQITYPGYEHLRWQAVPEALRMNDSGWSTQLQNISHHVAARA